MNYNLHYSPESFRDLEEILSYIALELCNNEAADKMLDAIMNEIDKLIDFPNMGAALANIINIETNYRYIISGNYMIFYRIEQTDIYIDRILYSRRDYVHILFK